MIDWFQPWPESALFDVAKRFLDDVDLGKQECKDAITKFMPYSFGQVTPQTLNLQPYTLNLEP